MAATDQTYRNQKRLDIVFAISCVAMLIAVVIMFSQDFYREFKVEQRHFRDVEAAMAQRTMLRQLPDDEALQRLSEAEQQVAAQRKELEQAKSANASQVGSALPAKIRSEAHYQAVKADYDSVVSLRDIAVD